MRKRRFDGNRRFLGVAAAVLCLLILFLEPRATDAQTRNGIAEPEAGAEIGGIVVVTGTAVDPEFLRYEVAFRRDGSGDWIVFAQGDQSVIDGTLAVWDTTVGRETVPVFPDGRYQLRLRVVRQDYNYDEFIVSDVVVANDSLTPTPEASLTAGPVDNTSGTDSAGTAVPAGANPAVLPTLTPFPTPSPAATSLSVPLGPGEASGQRESAGLAQRLGQADYGRLLSAFWVGVAITATAFAGLGLYVGMRAIVRRLRHRLRRRRLS